MKRVSPTVKSTLCSPDLREWVPTSVDNFFRERDHIVKTAEENDHLVLFRGQSHSGWLLDSTFVRDATVKLFGYPVVPNSVRRQVSFHRMIASLLLMKFGTIVKPSEEALEKERSHGIDPWFELLKNGQQYPEKNRVVEFVDGTFLLDWTTDPDIGLYFAVYGGRRGNQSIDETDGALWIYDGSSTGGILQEEKLGKILGLMTGADFLNGDKTFPLMFHPRRQTRQLRAMNQKPIYIAQMDFRYDLAEVWASYESTVDEQVFVKLHLLQQLKPGFADYLESRKVTEDHVYPD